MFSLDQLGWSACLAQQLSLEDLSAGYPARVAACSAAASTCCANAARSTSSCRLADRRRPDAAIAVGDWVLIEHEAPRVLRSARATLAGLAAWRRRLEQRLQLIAANLDTLFVVTSCNDDFNLSRLERYLAVAHAAQVEPVIVLTKVDLCADGDTFAAQARSIARDIAVLALNATSRADSDVLAPWLGRGQTVAFVGSSGVGKSTLVNTLLGGEVQATGGIREDDAKGRHTTTSRQMFALPSGAWVIDTPGMRELKLGAVDSAVSAVFDDIETLARDCRFRDCQHRDDGGMRAARCRRSRADSTRVGSSSYLKLQREASARAHSRARAARDRAALGPHAPHHFAARSGNFSRMTRTASSASSSLISLARGCRRRRSRSRSARSARRRRCRA